MGQVERRRPAAAGGRALFGPGGGGGAARKRGGGGGGGLKRSVAAFGGSHSVLGCADRLWFARRECGESRAMWGGGEPWRWREVEGGGGRCRRRKWRRRKKGGVALRLPSSAPWGVLSDTGGGRILSLGYSVC